MLQAIRPTLQIKIAECYQNKRIVSEFKNRAFQVACFVVKSELSSNSQILLQEPKVKDEDDSERSQDGPNDRPKGLFTYTALRSAKCVLVLVPEPFDANNSKSDRNRLVVLQLAMGQCIRRHIESRHVRTADDAKQLVQVWQRISKASPRTQQLSLYDIRLLILGAWKADRHALVPYLYQFACRQMQVSDEAGFQKLSAIVLSFYVREYAESIEPSVINGLLDDLNQRHIRLSPSHFSMLILYFGKVHNIPEALRVLEQAMEDRKTQGTEAIYYNTFRAFSYAVARQSRRIANDGPLFGTEISPEATEVASEQAGALDRSKVDDALSYIDDLDADIVDYMDYEADVEQQEWNLRAKQQQESKHGHSPEYAKAARICSMLFQTMVNRNIPIGFKTYRELIQCMARFGMIEKARSIFAFAVDNLGRDEIKADLVVSYLRSVAHTPHERQAALVYALHSVPGLIFAMRRYPRRVLIDQFAIYNGDLDAFIAREKRAVVPGRAGEFLRAYVDKMGRATRAAAFMNCILSGNDPGGQFKGFNFPKLGTSDLFEGVAVVEKELLATCYTICQNHPTWMQHRDVIYNLLPVLPGIVRTGDEPAGISLVRKLVDDCRDTSEFVDMLDKVGVEGYDIGIVNHFLRVKLLGLTFQRYVREKTEAAAATATATTAAAASHDKGEDGRGKRMFWPSYMYSQSSGWMAISSGSSSHAPATADAATAISMTNRDSVARNSWQHLSHLLQGEDSALRPDTNTVGIFALYCVMHGDWVLGQRVWDDVLYESDDDDRRFTTTDLKLPLLQQGVRIYKHYLYYIFAASPLAPEAAASQGVSVADSSSKGLPLSRYHSGCAHVFSDEAIAAMFGTMDRSGVDVTSGLLCQGVRAALELGNIDVAGALEQWQLHREHRGQAPVGFFHRFVAASGALPEISPRPKSVIELVRGDSAGCPRLSQHIASKISGGGV
ncbi:hypothetical protein LPJ53_001515 [Coemansia erecta]|uniref:Uncharacterized protein n=1 Tax=Coemansia erecta TaxID=147472 RepID=A0A9W7Y428_9FUNG|nr:hypothetical protein LPJ53_001515 [Coemansia erecta]